MPVTFAQPEPIAPAIQAGGGAAEQFAKDMPSLARLYETAMQTQTQGAIASAHNATQASIAHAQTMEAGTAAQESNRLRQQEFEASQQPSDRDVFLAQLQEHQVQQHAQAQAWLNQQEMSQAEVMQRQRLQNGLGALQEAHANGTLDDDAFYQGVMQLQTHLNPLNLKAQAQMAKEMDKQKKMELDAEARGITVEQLHAQQRAKDFENGVIRRPDGSEWHLDPKGKLEPLNEIAAKLAGKGGKAAEGGESAEKKEYNTQRLGWAKRMDALIQHARKEYHDALKDGTPEQKSAAKAHLDDLTENEQKNLTNDLHNAGLGYNWEEHQRMKGKGSNLPSGNAGSSNVGTTEKAGQGTGEGETVKLSQLGKWPEDPAKRNEAQKQVVENLKTLHNQIDQAPSASAEQKVESKRAVQDILSMLESGKFDPNKYHELEKKAKASLPLNPPKPAAPPRVDHSQWAPPWLKRLTGAYLGQLGG